MEGTDTSLRRFIGNLDARSSSRLLIGGIALLLTALASLCCMRHDGPTRFGSESAAARGVGESDLD